MKTIAHAFENDRIILDWRDILMLVMGIDAIKCPGTTVEFDRTGKKRQAEEAINIIVDEFEQKKEEGDENGS